MQNKHFTECQSGYMPADLCVSRLLSITHEIYKIFDFNSRVHTRETFIDISKAFEKD